MKRKVTVWQSLLAVLAALLVIGTIYAFQWRKPELKVVLVRPSTSACGEEPRAGAEQGRAGPQWNRCRNIRPHRTSRDALLSQEGTHRGARPGASLRHLVGEAKYPR